MGERVVEFLSRFPAEMKKMFSEGYFSEFLERQKEGLGTWHSSDGLDFAYFFSFVSADKVLLSFLLNNKKKIAGVMDVVGAEVLSRMKRLLSSGVSVPKYVLVKFMLTNKYSIQAGAFLEVGAGSSLFPIVESQNEAERNERLYHLVGLIMHELEHGAYYDGTCTDEFGEVTSTFVEYLSVPVGTGWGKEKFYLEDVRKTFEGERPKFYPHSRDFYVSLLVFANFLRKKGVSCGLNAIRDSGFEEQIGILLELRNSFLGREDDFLKLGVECLKNMYCTRNYRGLFALFREAENELGMKKRMPDF